VAYFANLLQQNAPLWRILNITVAILTFEKAILCHGTLFENTIAYSLKK